MRFFLGKILRIIFLLVLFCSITIAQETINYSLSKEKFDTLSMESLGDSIFTVFIKLNSAATKEFSKITENNIGKRLNIIFKDSVLISAVIKGKISSGLLSVSEFTNAEEAKNIEAWLNSNNYEKGD